MQDLREQEKFELEVLDKLNSGRYLSNLAFCGGTMLRLCFGLDRYSVDLDFWMVGEVKEKQLLKDLTQYLSRDYSIKDSMDKKDTLLIELKSDAYPRRLKLEIRKGLKKIKTERVIAYSKYSNLQVMVKAVSLDEMARSKVSAFLDRREIRDAFDLEFLFKK